MPRPIKYIELSNLLNRIRLSKIDEKGKVLSLRHISIVAMIDYSHIHQVFAGQSLPSRMYLIRICNVMQCDRQEASSIFKLTDYREPDSDELHSREHCSVA